MSSIDQLPSTSSSASSLQPEPANLFRLQFLLNGVTSTHLRKTFHSLWEAESGYVWTNTPQDGQQLITGLGQALHSRSQRIQKRLLREGNCENWDLPLLVDVIKLFKSSSEVQSSKLDGLRDIRNQIAHVGGLNLETQEFEKLWLKAANILTSLGIEQNEIDMVKILKFSDADASKDETPDSQNVISQECLKLKDEGNGLYRQQKFGESICKYSQAINLEGITNKELAVLYSNRSAAYFSVGNTEEAKFDAKNCITLRPMWFRGYYRLAKAYQTMQKFDKALENYEKSLMLKPNEKEIEEARDYCRIRVTRQERKDHLDPLLQVSSREDIAERFKRLGISVGPNIPHPVMQNYMKGLPFGICGEAHKYMHGLDGCDINYEMAANLFAQAARKGSAEGLYNLALLTQEGKGVKLDIAEGHRLLLQAANQDPNMELIPGSGEIMKNIGVVEAQHALGLDFEKGIGVRVNYAKAKSWYEKALENGSGFSANNLAHMYSAGIGVSPDIYKAILYWKLSALKGTVRASENLANFYLETSQMDLARNWYLYAVYHGSSVLVWRKDEFCISAEWEKSFNVPEFERKLQEELRGSELSPLATFANEFGEPDKIKEMMERKESGSFGYDKRTTLIKEIRKGIKDEKTSIMCFSIAGFGHFVPKVDVDLVGLKPITMKEFDESIDDKVYEGFILKVTVIEDAHIRPSSIFLVVQDDDGNAERVFIYNYPKNGNIQLEIGYGTKFDIVNPYFRRMTDECFAIRIDDPNMIFRHAALADPKRCRFCGKPNTKVPCRKCKRVFYCDKLCMKKDSKELQHELVCYKKLAG